MRYGTLQLPPYRMFAAVCILLGATATKHHHTNTSMLYVSNKYLHAKNLHIVASVPRQKHPRNRPGERAADQKNEQQARGVVRGAE